MEISELNDLLKRILGAEPLDKPKEINMKMLQGLAEIYANEGFREYMENAIKINVWNAATAVSDEKVALVIKGRLITLKELLGKAKEAFLELEKIKKIQSKKQ